MFDKKTYDQTYYKKNKAKYQDYNKQRRIELKLKLLEYRVRLKVRSPITKLLDAAVASMMAIRDSPD